MSGSVLIPKTGDKPLLYSYCVSSCAWRVRTVLNLKKIDFNIEPVSFSSIKEEVKYEEYRKVSPMLQVPALVIDGHTLVESVAIMHYLEETYPQCPILPQDPYKRALVREIVEIICSSIQPMQNTAVLLKIDEEKRHEWAKHFILRGFRAIEQILSSSAGKYCVGDEITMADCCLVPQVFNAIKRFHLDLIPYPTIVRINQELESHPAFLAAHPSNQPDFDPKILNM